MPFSKYVSIAVEGKEKNNALEVKVPGPHGVTYVAGLQPMSTLKVERKSKKKPLGDQTVIAYWIVRRVQDKNMANMRKATMPCTMTIDAGGDAVTHKVSLPILQNTKPLKVGEELLLHEEPQPASAIAPAQTLQPEKKRKPLSKKVASPVKRRRK